MPSPRLCWPGEVGGERMPERHGVERARVIAAVIALIALLTAAITILNLREYSLDNPFERYVVIFGWVGVIVSSLGLVLMLISAWAYGGAGYLRRMRPGAVVLRSGSMPELSALLEDDLLLRAKLSRVRPPGILFVLVVDASGIEIWHGSGKGSPTGSLDRAAILSSSQGTTRDGIRTYNTIQFSVRSGEDVVRVPFVIRSAEAVFGAGKRATHVAHDAVVRALSGIQPEARRPRLR
ncbi:hypothetical protein [Herbiconiux sp. UC225_62]|uniref:hypothetical protein n=1 Tax=Herbiconiux sp. UC225_62 TaxID=3350168 RepID=UPI0036D3D460